MPKFKLENISRIYDDHGDGYLEIGPHEDNSEFAEIREFTYVDNQPKITNRIVIHPDCLELIIQSLTSFLNNKKVH